MARLGQRTLLVNPPLVNGVAFTRQGRCQEREEVLGTTKPPYTLALLAAMFRDAKLDVRLVDLTATGQSIEQLIADLDRDGFQPTLILYPSTTPTLDADTHEVAKLKARYGAPLFCFGPHASTVPIASMQRAPEVDGMFVGEPEDAAFQLAGLESIDRIGTIPSLVWRRPSVAPGADAGTPGTPGTIVPNTAQGSYAGFLSMPYPAWDLVPLRSYSLPLVNRPYTIVETSRGCPYACDFCVAPIHQGHKFRERSATAIVDEIERGYREHGLDFFYLWGDTVTLNVKSFSAFCDELIARNLPVQWLSNARADNLTDPAFVHRLRKAGCWMLAMGIETESEDIRKDMVKRLERAKIQQAIRNMRDAGIRSFAFFIFGYPGETIDTIGHTIDYAIELDPDFANFYPAVPYPGTELFTKAVRDGLLASDEADWSRMEYSYYLLRGNGLDEAVVMDAINRAKRRFFMRPKYLARKFGDVLKLAATKPQIFGQIASRTLFGAKIPPPAQPARPAPEQPARPAPVS
jgi:radical SAM superfamily enzyme YgiQ (UPF0313 family)